MANDIRRAMLTARLQILNDPVAFVELLLTCQDEQAAREQIAQAYRVSGEVVDALLDLSFRRVVRSNTQRIQQELDSLTEEP